MSVEIWGCLHYTHRMLALEHVFHHNNIGWVAHSCSGEENQHYKLGANYTTIPLTRLWCGMGKYSTGLFNMMVILYPEPHCCHSSTAALSQINRSTTKYQLQLSGSWVAAEWQLSRSSAAVLPQFCHSSTAGKAQYADNDDKVGHWARIGKSVTALVPSLMLTITRSVTAMNLALRTSLCPTSIGLLIVLCDGLIGWQMLHM